MSRYEPLPDKTVTDVLAVTYEWEAERAAVYKDREPYSMRLFAYRERKLHPLNLWIVYDTFGRAFALLNQRAQILREIGANTALRLARQKADQEVVTLEDVFVALVVEWDEDIRIWERIDR